MEKSLCTDDCSRVIERYSAMVYRLALTRTKNKADAEDVFQEVFLRYYKNQDRITSEDHLKAWLIRATINYSNSLMSSAWFRKTAPLSEEIPFETPEEHDLYSTVMKLPQKYRTVIHLFYYEDLPVKEISNILGIGESTVKSQLSRARAQLKAKLKGEYEDV